MVKDLPDFTDGLYLMGQDESGNTVIVRLTDTGQIEALLKGSYLGTLTTVAVDANGNVQVQTLDDESQWGDTVVVGNAELAARLGSPVTWDWRGKVIWLTDMSRGLGWATITESGTGASVALDPTNWMTGGYSAKMIGGSDGGKYASVRIGVTKPPTDRVGVAVRWASDVAFDHIELLMQMYTGSDYYLAQVKFDYVAEKLFYWGSDNAYHVLADAKVHWSANWWHALKLVADMSTGKYTRLLFGDDEHDMTAYSMYTVSSNAADNLTCLFYVVSDAGENDYVWLDSVIITVGEPE